MRTLLKQKAYRSFLFSFLCIFVLPTLLMLYFMSSTLSIAQNEERIATQLMLEQYKNGVDGQMNAIKRIGDTLVVDDKALLFSSAKDETEYLKSTTVFQAIRGLMQQVATITIANEHIEVAYLYFPMSSKVISNTAMDAPVFYQRRIVDHFPSYEDFIGFLTSNQDGFVRVNKHIYYLRTFDRGGVPSISCAISLAGNFFNSFKTLSETKEGMGFTLLSPEGELLFTTLEDASFLTEQALDSGTVSYDGTKLYLHQSVSADTLCLYVVTIPENVYTARLVTMQTIFGILAGVILIAGIVMSFTLAKRRYAPIRHLRELVGERPQESETLTGDDFSYLSETVEAMKDEKMDINRQLKYASKRMNHFQLEKLLNGTYSTAAVMEEELLKADVAFASDTFALAGIHINRIDAADLVNDKPLADFVIGNVYEELLAKYAPHVVSMEEMNVIILSLPEEAGHEALVNALQTGCNVLSESFSMHLCINLGHAVHGLNELRVAYLELRNEMSVRKGEDGLFFSWQESASSVSDRNADMDAAAHKLSRLVLIGAYDDVLNQYEVLKKASEGQPAWSVRMMLSSLVRECMDGLALRLDSDIMKQLSILSQHYIESPVGLDEFQTVFKVIKTMTRSVPTSTGKTKNDDIGRLAWEYISQNYASADMSIQAAADHLGLTASYCSQLYKRQTGRAMLDDINQMRLNRAKELLRGTHLGLEEIAIQTGFLNSSTFIRTFKKYEGITPGQYRQSVQG